MIPTLCCHIIFFLLAIVPLSAQIVVPNLLREYLDQYKSYTSLEMKGRTIDLFFNNENIDTLSNTQFNFRVNGERLHQKVGSEADMYFDGKYLLVLSHNISIAYFSIINNRDIPQIQLKNRFDSLLAGLRYVERSTDSSVFFTVLFADSSMKQIEVEILNLSKRLSSIHTRYMSVDGKTIRISSVYLDSFKHLDSNVNQIPSPLDFIRNRDGERILVSPFDSYQLLPLNE